MTAADTLRGMVAPAMVQAVNAGADALDQVVRLEATVAGLETTRDDLTAKLAAATARIATLEANQRPAVPDTYVVQAGDYLLKIGRQFLVQVADITAWNRLTTDVIQPGQVLYLKGAAPEPTPTPTPVPVPEPVPTPVPVPAPPVTVFSVDISNLGDDATLTEAAKLNGHKTLFGVDNLQNVRHFFGARPLSWTEERLAALTDKDSVLISVSTRRTRTEIRNFLAATPAKFRQRKGQVKACYKHECEAEWKASGKSAAWMTDYLAGNLDWAEELDASPFATQSRDDVVKIMLWYSQHIAASGVVDTMDAFYGGQDFGVFGMDCYHYQVWLNNGRYATPEELFGKLVAFGKKVGRPVAAPEWGGEVAAGDTDGARRAQAIADGGAYCKANGLLWANWWCADGSRDGATGLPRKHHVDPYPSNVAAMTALIQGA